MIAAQLLAAHNAAMEGYRRAMLAEQTFEVRRENLSQANRLSRTYALLPCSAAGSPHQALTFADVAGPVRRATSRWRVPIRTSGPAEHGRVLAGVGHLRVRILAAGNQANPSMMSSGAEANRFPPAESWDSGTPAGAAPGLSGLP